MDKKRILIVENETVIADDIEISLLNFGYEVCDKVLSGEEAIQKTTCLKPDLVLMDLVLEGEMNGIEAAKYIIRKFDIPIIFITAFSDDNTLIKVKEAEPYGYIIKPFNERKLYTTIEIALDKHKKEKNIRSKYKRTVKKYQQAKKFGSMISGELEKLIRNELVGQSEQITNVLKQAMTAAKYKNTNVMIVGETGTGKEIIARIIHYASERKENYFCVVNSSAIPETLIVSEFFGHVKGAFTGAINNKKGFLEIADKGTLFLDEIADMPVRLQAKLLRVIENKQITRIGGQKNLSVDFRIISATNKDIFKLVQDNRFRLDLIHRLNTMVIKIPPLRERLDDIEPLLEYYVKKISHELNKTVPDIDPTLIYKLKNYQFPGNVRELKNLVENALIHCNKPVLEFSDFSIPDLIPVKKESEENIKKNEDLSLEATEIRHIRKVLEIADFNQTRAAGLLKISRDSLIRRLKKYNIKIRKY